MRKGPLQPFAQQFPVRLAIEDKAVHPAVAAIEHLDQQVFHLLPAVIAPQQQFFDGRAEGRAGLIDLPQSFAGRAAIEFLGLRGNLEAAAQAGEQRLLQGQFAAKGINRRDAELGRQVEQLPAERLRAPQRAMGQRFHREIVQAGRGFSLRIRFPTGNLCFGGGFFEFGQNPVAHLGGGGIGEGDGHHLAGLLDLGQQAEKAAGEQVGLA